MGAISKYGDQLIGKYFYFGFSRGVDFVGKIESIAAGKDFRKLLTVKYSPVWHSGTRYWMLSHFSLGSSVDEECIIFDKLGGLIELFKLFH